VAAKTRETLLVCEAAGFDVVMVETVGVGQSETSVATMVDFFLALMITGAGDELQGIKKGVLEVADAIAINKADGDNLKRAEKARLELEIAMHLVSPDTPTWRPPVLTCSSVLEQGTRRVWETVLEHRRRMQATGEFFERRRKQSLAWLWTLVEEGLKLRFRENRRIAGIMPGIARRVEREEISPSAAAQELLSCL
jgi:LAO/AO transport system kinase